MGPGYWERVRGIGIGSIGEKGGRELEWKKKKLVELVELRIGCVSHRECFPIDYSDR